MNVQIYLLKYRSVCLESFKKRSSVLQAFIISRTYAYSRAALLKTNSFGLFESIRRGAEEYKLVFVGMFIQQSCEWFSSFTLLINFNLRFDQIINSPTFFIEFNSICCICLQADNLSTSLFFMTSPTCSSTQHLVGL